MSRLRPAAVGICSVLLVFGAGAGAYAYESPQVVEGHPLYPMKTGLERAEAAIATGSPERAAAFHAKMVERRIEEAETIDTDVERKQEVEEKVIEKAADALERYSEAASRVQSDKPIRAKVKPEVGEIIKRVRESGHSREEKRREFKEEARRLIKERREARHDEREKNQREDRH